MTFLSLGKGTFIQSKNRRNIMYKLNGMLFSIVLLVVMLDSMFGSGKIKTRLAPLLLLINSANVMLSLPGFLAHNRKTLKFKHHHK
jgi:hypothetical protein